MGVPSVMGKRGALLKLAVSVGAWLTIRGGATCLVGTWRVRDEYWMKRGRAGPWLTPEALPSGDLCPAFCRRI